MSYRGEVGSEWSGVGGPERRRPVGLRSRRDGTEGGDTVGVTGRVPSRDMSAPVGSERRRHRWGVSGRRSDDSVETRRLWAPSQEGRRRVGPTEDRDHFPVDDTDEGFFFQGVSLAKLRCVYAFPGVGGECGVPPSSPEPSFDPDPPPPPIQRR